MFRSSQYSANLQTNPQSDAELCSRKPENEPHKVVLNQVFTQ